MKHIGSFRPEGRLSSRPFSFEPTHRSPAIHRGLRGSAGCAGKELTGLNPIIDEPRSTARWFTARAAWFS
jgi:hypothetical protein